MAQAQQQTQNMDPQQQRNIVGRAIVSAGYSREEASRCLDGIFDQSPGYLAFLANKLTEEKPASIEGFIKSFVKNGWLPAAPGAARNQGQPAPGTASAPQPAAPRQQPRGAHQGARQSANEDAQRYDQVKVFGRKAAITVHAIWSDDRKTCEGMMFDFAEVDMNKPKKNGRNQFGWDRKVMFAATEVECVAICLTLLGRTQKLKGLVQSKLREGGYGYDDGIYHQNGPFKKLGVELQDGGNVYISIATNQDAEQGKTRLIGVPVGHGDRIKLAGFIMSRLRMTDTFRGMSASDILSLGSAVLRG